MARYILVDASGEILNAIEYDGVSPVPWPAGVTAHRHDTARHGVDTFDPIAKVLTRDADPAHIEREVKAAEVAAEQAEHEALVAKLAEGKATPEEAQAALAKVLGKR